jgi:hypothetical protein
MKTSMFVLAASVVFGAAAFATNEACTSSASDTGDDTGPGNTPTVDSCTQCLAQNCRPETERCVNDADCQAILSCIEVANDAGGCASESSSANGRCLFEQLTVCELSRECDTGNATGCYNACVGTINPQCPDGVLTDGSTDAAIVTVSPDGGATVPAAPTALDCPGGDTSGATACDVCAAASCAAEAKACVETSFTSVTPNYGSQCNDYASCRTECRDSACLATCVVGFPTGKTASDAYDACLAASCGSVCGAAVTGDGGVTGDAAVTGDAGDGG